MENYCIFCNQPHVLVINCNNNKCKNLICSRCVKEENIINHLYFCNRCIIIDKKLKINKNKLNEIGLTHDELNKIKNDKSDSLFSFMIGFYEANKDEIDDKIQELSKLYGVKFE